MSKEYALNIQKVDGGYIIEGESVTNEWNRKIYVTKNKTLAAVRAWFDDVETPIVETLNEAS